MRDPQSKKNIGDRDLLGKMEDRHHTLELTLISAQGLKSPLSSNLRRLQTFAVAWIQPSTKLRTRIDRVGSQNPTWNDKFLFRIPPSFLSSDTSAVTVDIYALGVVTDPLLGSVRILLSSFLPHWGFFPVNSASASSADLRIAGIRAPAFGAFQIRRPSGRYHGVLNVAAMVIDGSDFGSLAGVTAVGYRDLMGKKTNALRKRRPLRLETGEELSGSESWGGESSEMSDGGESTTSTSSAATSSAPSPMILSELNGRRALEVKRGEKILCGLGFPRKMHISSSDENKSTN